MNQVLVNFFFAARKQEDDFRSLPEADQHNMRQLRARKSQEQKE